MIRGLDTTVKRLRHQVFTEVANLGFNVNPDTLNDDMEAIPYKMVNEDTPRYREERIQSPFYCQRASAPGNGDCRSDGGQTGASDCRSGGK